MRSRVGMNPSLHLPSALIPTNGPICKWMKSNNLKAPLPDSQQTNPLTQFDFDWVTDSLQTHPILNTTNMNITHNVQVVWLIESPDEPSSTDFKTDPWFPSFQQKWNFTSVFSEGVEVFLHLQPRDHLPKFTDFWIPLWDILFLKPKTACWKLNRAFSPNIPT